MGQSWSSFWESFLGVFRSTPPVNTLTEEELTEYCELTYLSKKEIFQLFVYPSSIVEEERWISLRVYHLFSSLAPAVIRGRKNIRLPKSSILTLPQLAMNPFKDRIVRVFSPDGEDSMSFEDVLDMFSVLSDKAPRTLKIETAFQIYDFDEDDMISGEDIKELLRRLASDDLVNNLDANEVEQVINYIMDEADIDNDHLLAYAEFDHAIAKTNEFLRTFRLKL